MTAPVEIHGLEGLRQRLAALGAMTGLDQALRAEAVAVAAGAKATLASRYNGSPLSHSVQIVDAREGDSPAFAIGTDEPAGRYFEFGTTRMRAFPWLRPSLHARSPSVNRSLRKLVAMALKPRGKA